MSKKPPKVPICSHLCSHFPTENPPSEAHGRVVVAEVSKKPSKVPIPVPISIPKGSQRFPKVPPKSSRFYPVSLETGKTGSGKEPGKWEREDELKRTGQKPSLPLLVETNPDNPPLVRCRCGDAHFWHSRHGWQCSGCWDMPLAFTGESISLAAHTPAASREESVSQSFPKSPEVARLADAFYSHLFQEPRCCWAAWNQYCADGERLRQAYYSAAQAVPGHDCGLHLVTDEKAARKAQEGPQRPPEPSMTTNPSNDPQTPPRPAKAATGASIEETLPC